jgi:hypothetical protein
MLRAVNECNGGFIASYGLGATTAFSLVRAFDLAIKVRKTTEYTQKYENVAFILEFSPEAAQVSIVGVSRVVVNRHRIADGKNALAAIDRANVPCPEGLPRNYIAELVAVVILWFVSGQYSRCSLFPPSS